MPKARPMNVSIIGAGSTYGVFLVKWALQLKYFPETNLEPYKIPPIGSISYSNTADRSMNLVMEVLQDDLSHMPSFAHEKIENYTKNIRGYVNWREMVAREKPGLVVICSPIETHVAYIRELVSDFKIKNILCEPPLCHIEESDSLPGIVRLAQSKKVSIGVNQQYSIFYDKIRALPLNPASGSKGGTVGGLMSGIDGLDVTFITHGPRVWRNMQGVGEQEILEDLGPHVYSLIPEPIRARKMFVKNVKKEGDNLFLNFVEYNLAFGKVPVRLTLGYHRQLKSLKLIFKKKKKDYEFFVSGATNPQTGEFTRWIECKNSATPFKHFLATDLVKASFISSLAGKPVAPLQAGVKSVEFVRALYQR